MKRDDEVIELTKFRGRKAPAPTAATDAPPAAPKIYRYTVNWANVTHLERMRDGGCKLYFVGGNFIIVDRKFDELDAIAKKEWRRIKEEPKV